MSKSKTPTSLFKKIIGMGVSAINFIMGKIKLIEESRLSELEMSLIYGGDGGLDCFKDTYRATEGDNCFGWNKYADCPVSYYSCNTNGVVTCNVATSKYRGPQGGAGYAGIIDYEVNGDMC